MNGLFILRQIDPPALLVKALTELPSKAHPGYQQLIELESGEFWTSDADVRDVSLNHAITGWEDDRKNWNAGCTKGFGIFDSDFTRHAYYRDLGAAERALAGAKPKFVTEFDIPSEEPEPVEPKQRKKPFEA